MAQALQEFKGTPEEQLLAICHADVVLARGDVDKALELLKVGAQKIKE